MSSKPTGADVNLAYPQAEIAVMGAEGAVNILYRKSAPEEKAEIIKEYEDKFSTESPAERGLIDEVIMPREHSLQLIQALEMCHNKNQSNPPRNMAICLMIKSRFRHRLLRLHDQFKQWSP